MKKIQMKVEYWFFPFYNPFNSKECLDVCLSYWVDPVWSQITRGCSDGIDRFLRSIEDDYHRDISMTHTDSQDWHGNDVGKEWKALQPELMVKNFCAQKGLKLFSQQDRPDVDDAKHQAWEMMMSDYTQWLSNDQQALVLAFNRIQNEFMKVYEELPKILEEYYLKDYYSESGVESGDLVRVNDLPEEKTVTGVYFRERVEIEWISPHGAEVIIPAKPLHFDIEYLYVAGESFRVLSDWAGSMVVLSKHKQGES